MKIHEAPHGINVVIETHDRPDQALSDGFQQLDLKAFAALLQGLGLDVEPPRMHVQPKSAARLESEQPRTLG